MEWWKYNLTLLSFEYSMEPYFVANKFYHFFQARELMENEKQLPDIRLQARPIHTVLFGTKPEL